MNKLISRKLFQVYATSKKHYQVTVVGGASDIGQTLCLLLRAEPAITKLVVHDTRGQTPGVVLDLSHIPTEANLQGYTGEDTLDRALKNAHIVIGAGGLIRKPGITEKLWLSANTSFVKTLATKVAKLEPMPFLGIVTEPINSVIPMAAEVLRNHGEYDPRKLFGITGIDALRAQTLYAAQNNFNPRNCMVPVIGGHSDKTAIPLLSQSQPDSAFDAKMSQEFTLKFRKTDDRILRAKRGFSPILSVAFSALLFTRSVLDALDGRPARVNAFIENNDFGTSYFGGLVHINHVGVKEMQRYTSLTQYECQLLERSFDELRRDVLKGKKVLELA
ncbi:malate dehydrogenase-like [Helicoverpa zea]|uniref:malate dehydrogenase-like n=1 Tax=Helicoverpa zea TaxID=7113 RepID=UPI000B3A81C3|nr:malate dehydrogenase [Helicoverpa armigera]XP_047023514.1 malate dehydrogenase-like [Helicoverpa zea]PZC82550.1 hypothetical protein B5X24_HaOG210299 [Helicoverpa armigera]